MAHPIGFRLWKNKCVVEAYKGEDYGCNSHSECPRERNVMGSTLNVASNIDQNTLSEDRGKTIESASDTYKKALLLLVECQHVKTIGGNIVCSRSKGRYYE